ncbi:unnamed protein product [Tilletia laevis]|uniref:Hydantoinase B/oxoprolinase domain-containing protein n=2 Tax=Tilletia TaxID=13289 RepID=A0A9N8QL98_9BASI|nr:hypothetical protein CF336_g3585 [Tilletia laevis]KAE8261845.1 hypothetical protein A4X03_0g2923 [Tilletia caries]KAE8204028.1 hypothetical protein CF335_g2802 [Tilletia laevis]CAD6893001.1 unnamed protein product [Tilletia caries]CAD6956296.1 unnamed protein product [Tilletia laevis]
MTDASQKQGSGSAGAGARAGSGGGGGVGGEKQTHADADPILLSLFGQRFIAIAEAMGRVLEQTSVSTNIKERLDFSAALFSPDGSLVANAPHLPVHLGSMSYAVRWQIDHLKSKGERFQPGDVILANHPAAGGSHLPDMTVITPVFKEETGKGMDEIIFFCATRGHHADIGGILPGSMPPTSTHLREEGAAIFSFKIVSEGVFDHEGLEKLLVHDPAQYPGCSGSRCFRDVESDLKAQIAANQKGINLIQMLVEEWSLQTVQEYMSHIRANADYAVRNLLREVAHKQHTDELKAIDYMDDGTPIALSVKINKEEGSAIFDFEGTGPEVIFNFNCPRSVVASAIIYCLRSMVSQEIPLNQGCLEPIEIKIPKGCLLDPSDSAAVVGGNVMTSQRITDVVLRAFEACAASQGCCNNLTFGLGGRDEQGNHVEGFGYYETIAGGSGAGPSWHGTSGVHTHMTNTRITDPEIFERRYPVVLRQFSLRPNSGGAGKYTGGCGVIRDIEFLSPSIQVSILSERRVFAPYGLQGGQDAMRGRNSWIKRRREADGDLDRAAAASRGEGGKLKLVDRARTINLGGKTTARFGRGDRIVIETPGGGGWGPPGEAAGVAAGEEEEEEEEEKDGGMKSRTQAVGASSHRAWGSLADRSAAQLGA